MAQKPESSEWKKIVDAASQRQDQLMAKQRAARLQREAEAAAAAAVEPTAQPAAKPKAKRRAKSAQ